MIFIHRVNDVHLMVECEIHVARELSTFFEFEVPGAKFMPAFRNRMWDGKIRLFNLQTGEIYVGLLDKIVSFCKRHDYQYHFKDSKFFGLPFEINEMISLEGVKDYMNHISKTPPRDYQIEGVYLSLIHI